MDIRLLLLLTRVFTQIVCKIVLWDFVKCTVAHLEIWRRVVSAKGVQTCPRFLQMIVFYQSITCIIFQELTQTEGGVGTQRANAAMRATTTRAARYLVVATFQKCVKNVTTRL